MRRRAAVPWVPPADLALNGHRPRFPFAGIMQPRIYPQTGLTTARWIAEVPTRWVRFADLWLTQDGVDILALFGHSVHIGPLDDFPHVVEWQGIRCLEDGHHRVVRAALCTDQAGMDMRVFASPSSRTER